MFANDTDQEDNSEVHYSLLYVSDPSSYLAVNDKTGRVFITEDVTLWDNVVVLVVIEAFDLSANQTSRR